MPLLNWEPLKMQQTGPWGSACTVYSTGSINWRHTMENPLEP